MDVFQLYQNGFKDRFGGICALVFKLFLKYVNFGTEKTFHELKGEVVA